MSKKKMNKIQSFLERMEDGVRKKQFELEELEDEKEERIDEECPFTPNLTNISRKIMSGKERKPLYKR